MSEQSPTHPRQVTSLGGNRYAVDDGHSRSLAYATQVGQIVWVFFGGRVYEIHSGDSDTSRGGQRDEEALAAPMPATVVTIEVTVGQQVSRGDVLVRLEAMKMELSIASPRDATIAAINCRPGEVVQPGTALVELA